MKIIIRMQKPLIATDKNIKTLIHSEIQRLGVNADLNHIDVSQVTNMTSLFENIQFNGDISKWNVSNVADMSYLFTNSHFNGDIRNWNVSSVKDMDFVFQGSDFIHNISDWKFHPYLKLNHDLLRVIENSYQIKAAQEAALMKNEITLMKNKILNSL